jgi:hypothetical protein
MSFSSDSRPLGGKISVVLSSVLAIDMDITLSFSVASFSSLYSSLIISCDELNSERTICNWFSKFVHLEYLLLL